METMQINQSTVFEKLIISKNGSLNKLSVIKYLIAVYFCVFE